MVDVQHKLALHFGLELSRAKIQYASSSNVFVLQRGVAGAPVLEKSQAVFAYFLALLIFGFALPMVFAKRVSRLYFTQEAVSHMPGNAAK
ncbi:hypothetical protein [Collimonas arenae]|uniref:hypothetical protein n=1 Tax=Collimonas arenae TaxID=279058 RepID=UPI0012DFFCD7|nr:hypothetical protein [Collimonas arenae]